MGAGAQGEPYDQPLVETSNFFVIPSIGALVPGWLLICPKTHATNMSAFYRSPELAELRRSLTRMLANQFDAPVRAFEHGAFRAGSRTGCGVDHAHLHLVPLSSPLHKEVVASDSSLDWISTDSAEVCALASNEEYLFFSDHAEEAELVGSIALLDQPRSQFFRRIIAAQIGKQDEFNYRTNPNFGNTILTASALQMRARLSSAGSLEQT
jgi:diadenosine tetraphosphate (Ap4A) HIT family hydrolase